MAVRPIFLLLWLGHLLFVFGLVSCAFLEFGSFNWIKKRGKKSQEVRDQEAWNPSIIAVEPGDSKAWSPNQHKLNMAENLMVDVIIKSKKVEKWFKPFTVSLLFWLAVKRFHSAILFLYSFASTYHLSLPFEQLPGNILFLLLCIRILYLLVLICFDHCV